MLGVKRGADFDVDRDGIADAWEREHRLDPANPSDGNGTTLNKEGYTYLEVYINGLANKN